MAFNLILLVVLILLALTFLAAPLRRPLRRDGGTSPRLMDLSLEKRRTLELIRDLEFDKQVGKILDDDYRSSLEEYKARAIQIMKEMDALLPRQRVEDLVDEEIGRIRSELKRASGA